jgi:hypothetical protein
MEEDRKRKPLPRPWGHPPRTVVPLKVPNLTVDAPVVPVPQPQPPQKITAQGVPAAPAPPPQQQAAPPAPAPAAPPLAKQTLIATPTVHAAPPAPAPVPAMPLPAPQPQQQQPFVPGAPTAEDSLLPLVRGNAIVELARAAARRATKLHVRPEEILPPERSALTLESPPIIDPGVQTLLVWRRSVLIAIAVLMVPLVIVRCIVLAKQSGPATPDGVVGLQTIPLLAEIAFAAVSWLQLRHWTRWAPQRRAIATAWLATLAATVVAYLYPMRNFYDDILPGEAGIFAGAMVALQMSALLAGKVLALAPGVTRAAVRATETRWLVAPVAAVAVLVALLVLLPPFQISGSGWFILAILAVAGAHVVVARAMALRVVLAAAGAAVLLTLVAFSRLHLGAWAIVDLALSLVVSTLAVTMIVADLFIHPEEGAIPPA